MRGPPTKAHSGAGEEKKREGGQAPESGTNQELLTFLYISRGSVGEVRSMLCLLEKMPLFRNQESEIRNLREKTESISKQLGAWMRALRASDLKGQRYVTETVRRRAATKRDREEFLEQLRSG